MPNWQDHFRYEDGKLYWLYNSEKSKKWNSRYANTRAGSINHKRKRRIVRVCNKSFAEHRIIYEMINGPIPLGMEIDHINRDSFDNRIENLRLATRRENIINRTPKRVSSLGVVGVAMNKSGSYYAYIGVDGKQIYIGTFDTLEAASDARRAAAKEIFGDFNPLKGNENASN